MSGSFEFEEHCTVHAGGTIWQPHHATQIAKKGNMGTLWGRDPHGVQTLPFALRKPKRNLNSKVAATNQTATLSQKKNKQKNTAPQGRLILHRKILSHANDSAFAENISREKKSNTTRCICFAFRLPHFF